MCSPTHARPPTDWIFRRRSRSSRSERPTRVSERCIRHSDAPPEVSIERLSCRQRQPPAVLDSEEMERS
jgi:hypothetical protein